MRKYVSEECADLSKDRALKYMKRLEELHKKIEEVIDGKTAENESARQSEVFHEDGESDPSSKSCDG